MTGDRALLSAALLLTVVMRVLFHYFRAGCVAAVTLLAVQVSPVAGQDQRAAAGSSAQRECDREALQLGYKVLAVRAAIQAPAAPGAMAAIIELGTDSRYYVMVRGWLALQLQGDKSILAASRGEAPAEVAARVGLLEDAIRALDLE